MLAGEITHAKLMINIKALENPEVTCRLNMIWFSATKQYATLVLLKSSLLLLTVAIFFSLLTQLENMQKIAAPQR